MIRLENLVKVYPNSDIRVVDDLNLTIHDGEICVLIGTSGCGKTTTMRMINRLVPITSGTIYIDEQDIMEADPIELRRNIGYVIQEVGLFPHYTIEKNISAVPNEKKWEKDRIAVRVKEMMSLVELDYEQYAKKKPSSLSGGQKQRVGVARALAGDPPIMLMDEPFGSLDPITRNNLQNEFLLNIQSKLHKTIVFVTHDMDEAVKMGDKIAVMRNGKIEQYGTPHEILTHPANEFVESLVGQNRILKRFSLMNCGSEMDSAPFFAVSETQAILEALKSNAYVGITDADGKPIGYLDKAPGGSETIERCIIRTCTHVKENQTLYDAMSIMFARNEKVVFCVDDEHKARRLIGVTELFNEGSKDV